ncbi:MAG: hypothetical protein R2856_27960 [Caldilineaceae bacterium]
MSPRCGPNCPPCAIKEMQSGNIAPVDLAQASIGRHGRLQPLMPRH